MDVGVETPPQPVSATAPTNAMQSRPKSIKGLFFFFAPRPANSIPGNQNVIAKDDPKDVASAFGAAWLVAVSVVVTTLSTTFCGAVVPATNVIEGGTKLHIAPAGRPVQPKTTVPANCGLGVTVSVATPVAPRATVIETALVPPLVKMNGTAEFTTCVTVPCDAPKLVVAVNAAVIVCEATVSVVVEYVATPFVVATVASTVLPSEKTTEPTGTAVEVAAGATVAVNVTFPPKMLGFVEDVTAVVVAAAVTVSETVFAAGVLKFTVLVGVNCTDRVCVPAPSTVPAAGVYTNAPGVEAVAFNCAEPSAVP